MKTNPIMLTLEDALTHLTGKEVIAHTTDGGKVKGVLFCETPERYRIVTDKTITDVMKCNLTRLVYGPANLSDADITKLVTEGKAREAKANEAAAAAYNAEMGK